MDFPSNLKRWHVVYVKARHEKTFHSQVLESGIESFLPMKKELHTWSDRRKWVEVPLFSSYVFVSLAHGDRSRLYSLAGFGRFVTSDGKPSVVPQWQIDGIRKLVDFYPESIEVSDSDFVATEGIITGGPLAGIRGKIIDVKNGKSFAIKIDGIEKVLSVIIPVSLFKPLGVSGTLSLRDGPDASKRIRSPQ